MRTLPAILAILVTGCASVTTVPGAAMVRAPRGAARTSFVAARTAASAAPAPAGPPFAVGERTITFVDTSRTVRFPGRPPEPRTLVTVIRYPAQGPGSGVDLLSAPPARTGKRFPLVIFGHGFAVTPAPYAQLLQAWARAGYVVAAPIFPLGSANAPGGPDESDIVNQPRDMSFVITRMLELDGTPHSFFQGLIAPHEIAVSGQSDGGETALAVAYDRHFRDRRVRAAVIMSGAELPGVGALHFQAPSPPLLATQGTADTSNQPKFTYAFFDAAPRPKFLLLLLGASHLPPYTNEQPQLGVVERVTIDFLNKYLTNGKRALRRLLAAGTVPGVSAIQADPKRPRVTPATR
jgi:dienelactone hydrolase